MKFFRVLPFLFLLPACLSDEQQADIAAADSALKAEQTVDTFVVGKRSEIISTPEGESLRLENDTAIENMRLAISGNAGSEDEVITNSPVVRNPDVGPSFPGGSVAMDKFIAKNLIYPNIAYGLWWKRMEGLPGLLPKTRLVMVAMNLLWTSSSQCPRGFQGKREV